jgi:hypothetical protein
MMVRECKGHEPGPYARETVYCDGSCARPTCDECGRADHARDCGDYDPALDPNYDGPPDGEAWAGPIARNH